MANTPSLNISMRPVPRMVLHRLAPLARLLAEGMQPRLPRDPRPHIIRAR